MPRCGEWSRVHHYRARMRAWPLQQPGGEHFVKIGTVQVNGKSQLAVAQSAERVSLLSELWPDAPTDMLQVIAGGDELAAHLSSRLAGAPTHAVDSLHWLP